MWTNYRTRVFYYLFSECAGWYSPWSDGQAHKIQHLCQLSQEKLFSMADLQRSNLNHGWWAEAWPKENSFLLFQEELCQGSKSQFSGYVSEHSAYHQGESFLASTIIEFTCYVIQCELDCTEFLMKINAGCRILIWIAMT